MLNDKNDGPFLERALALARQSTGLASPNPYVGAVLVDLKGQVIGEGSHTYQGRKHAEVLAIEQAGSKSRGATLYINLEPCSHQGRTPPCADAVIAAGIRRVVACMADPNPKVSGRGFEQLRTAGVQVEVGELEQAARCLNEAFARYIRRGIPLVTLKAAMSIDGKIAPGRARNTSPGKFSGTWITGEPARAHAHELRHRHDAILVGVGTILADNPLLTDRSGNPRRRSLLRVILDSHLRLPLDSRIVQDFSTTAKPQSLRIFCTSPDNEKKMQLETRGIHIDQVSPDVGGRPDLAAVLRRLGELEITSVLIEGGTAVNGSALAAGIVDKVFFYYAPVILGGAAVPMTSGVTLETSNATGSRHMQIHRFGEDFALEGYLRDPYGD